jgi:dTDP-4-dehydrorhamnose reductase
MILITGFNGQLGYDLAKICHDKSIAYLGIDKNQLDITDKEAVNTFFNMHSIDAVIHCAAYTAVDTAEDDKDVCNKVNIEGTKNIVDACQKAGSKLLFISTDYVFDGKKKDLYETHDSTSPLSIYGQSKAIAENYTKENLSKYFIVRISWAFGINGKNFVRTMLRLGKEKDSISVVSDQFGSPTYTKDVAQLLVDIIQSEKYGIYHATNEGFCSWSELAEYIMIKASCKAKIIPILTSEYPTKAKRPMNSRLSKKSLDDAGFSRLPSWKDAIDRYLIELVENEGQL